MNIRDLLHSSNLLPSSHHHMRFVPSPLSCELEPRGRMVAGVQF